MGEGEPTYSQIQQENEASVRFKFDLSFPVKTKRLNDDWSGGATEIHVNTYTFKYIWKGCQFYSIGLVD